MLFFLFTYVCITRKSTQSMIQMHKDFSLCIIQFYAPLPLTQ